MVTGRKAQAAAKSDVALQAERVLVFLEDTDLKPDADGNISMPRSKIHTISWESDVAPLREADAINVSRGSPDPEVIFRVAQLQALADNLRAQDEVKMSEDNTFEHNENKRVARVAIGFLAQFSEAAFSHGQAAIPTSRVKELFSKSQIDRLVKAGAIQENPKVNEGIEKRVFNITRLEQLAGDRWDKIIKAGRECP